MIKMNMRFLSFTFILALLAGLISGCDEIDPPYTTGADHDHNGDNDGEVVRRVLLEEFTGHQCPNCPEGTQVAKDLKAFYGDQLVIVTIHAGWFANTDDDHFQDDFTTPEGDQLETHFQVNQFPVGLVNRANFDGSLLLSPSAWGEAMHGSLHESPLFDLHIHNEMKDGGLDVQVEVEVLEAADDTYHLSVFLTESDIIKPQKTNDPAYPSGVIEDYAHNYVLRTGLNGAFGELLGEEPMASGDLLSREFHLTWDEEWVPENSTVVAFVYLEGTGEVVQVNERPVLAN